MFTTKNDLHKFFTIRAIVPAAYKPQEMKSIPIHSENLWQVNRSIDRPQEWNLKSISSFSGCLSTFQGTSDLK